MPTAIMRGSSLLLVSVAVFGCVAYADRSPSPTGDAIAATQSWLGAVRAKDVAKVVALSRVPFLDLHVRDEKCPLKGQVQTPSEMQKLAACIVSNELLVESIPHSGEAFSHWKKVPVTQIKRKQFRALLAARARDHTIVSGSLMGDGITYTLFIAVRPDGGIDAVLAEAEVVG